MRGGGRLKGIPIGNLTSQIFANIYLNEFDRFVSHVLHPQGYVRYGDDFVLIMKARGEVELARKRSEVFLCNTLKLKLNQKNDIIVKTAAGVYFLGAEIFPDGRRLKKRNINRAITLLNPTNVSSYRGLIAKYSKKKIRRHFDWVILDMLENIS